MAQEITKILSDISYLQFQFTNINGQLKAVEVPKKYAEKYLKEGLGIDGSSTGFLATEQSDMRIKPDISTLHLLPWDTRIARVICDICDNNGNPHTSDPRSILKRALHQAKELGYEMQARPELEWYVMNADGEPADIGGYMDAPPLDEEIEMRRLITDFMMEFDVYPKMIHHEVGPSQHEIEFNMIDALLAADMVQTVKQIIRMVNWNNGLIASFIPKPYTTEAGNGLHVHHMLFKGKENQFSATDGTPSETLRYFAGGLLKHAPGMTAIMNPTVNSYKRLVTGHEAPVYVAWGIGNRTALIRVPGYEKSARIEYRGADTSANIYLVLALLLAAGINGIKNKIEPIEATILNIDRLTEEKREEMGIQKLPSNLKDALAALNADKFLCDFLGSQFVNIYNQTKKKEWEDYTHNVKRPDTEEVTEWEFNSMFERV